MQKTHAAPEMNVWKVIQYNTLFIYWSGVSVQSMHAFRLHVRIVEMVKTKNLGQSSTWVCRAP